MRIFVNQLRDPAYISGKPDYSSDLTAIRFASFNPILDPWVYILCRKNLLLKGCERLKRTVAQVKGGHGNNIEWVGSRHSPLSLHSNDTSCASIRTAHDRNGGEPHECVKTKSFSDFTSRPAWEYDTAQVNCHPCSVESTEILGDEQEGVAASKLEVAVRQTTHGRRVDVVTCTFRSPGSCQSRECL